MKRNPEAAQAAHFRSLGAALLIAVLASVHPLSGRAAAEQDRKPSLFAGVREFASPKEALAWIYAPYIRGNGLYVEDGDLARIFTPRMTDLVLRSRRASEILESESAGASPWMDAQDWSIREVKIDVRDTGPGRATATATYVNQVETTPKPRSFVFSYVRTERGWRIDEIRFPYEGSTARFGRTHDMSKMLGIEIAEGEKARLEEVAKAEQSGSLCKFGEGTIFACRTFGRQISICTDSQLHEPPQRWIEYRSGVPHGLDHAHRSEETGAPGSFFGSRQTRAGGAVSYVTFKGKDGYDYAAYADTSTKPARSGVTIRKSGRTMAEFRCDGGDVKGMPSDQTKMPSNMIQAVPFDGEILR